MNNGGINKANISNQTPFNHEEVGLWRGEKKKKKWKQQIKGVIFQSDDE